MTIDIDLFNEIFDDMLLGLEAIPEWVEPEVTRIIAPVCRVLKIARYKVDFYPNARAEADRTGRQVELFNEGEADLRRPFVAREINNAGNISIYSLFHEDSGPDWDAEDLEKLHLFTKMIYAFHGRKRLIALVEERTYTDYQLNVRNHFYVMRMIGQLIQKKEIYSYAMVSFNLKGFSLVNDRIGRDAGTKVMADYVKMLQAQLEAPGAIGRMGGDNFAGIFKKTDIDKVRTHLAGVGVVYNDETGERVFVSAIAGYYIADERDEIVNPYVMMDRVTMALSVARHAQDTMELFYSAEMQEKQTEQKSIERQFPDALLRGEFKVYYQPKIDLRDYSLSGAEALCRWVKQDQIIPPGMFIPVLEQSMNICILDFYMLERACSDIRRWMDQGRKPVRISVNLSRRHLGDMDLVEHIIDIIDRNHVPHEYIEIELTETTTDVEFGDLKRVVNSLQEKGIRTSVDDFGTGYSSLNLIKEISWNVLKLDKALLPVMAMEEKTNDGVMLRHVIAMATDLGLECIVEGVETKEQVELLLDNKCYLAQGFYFDKPLPVHKFEKRLDKKKDFYCEEGKREQ